jgi:hypothetical protein
MRPATSSPDHSSQTRAPARTQNGSTQYQTNASTTDTTAPPRSDAPRYDDTPAVSSTTSERYIRTPLFFDDANPQPKGTMDFRLRSGYMTESRGASLDSDDDLGIGLKWVWGPCDNAEVSLDLPINLGDGGKNPDELDGNGDLSVGMLYRLWQEGTGGDWVPAFALSTTIRTPTGDSSNGVDGELRGILTKTLVGDLRGHLNGFVTTVNNDNDPEFGDDNWWGDHGPRGWAWNGRGYDEIDTRHLQWGFVLGVDAPITSAKDVWVFADYMLRSSEHYGASDMNMAEVGVEWKLTDAQSVHVTSQVGLDDNGDTPNWGAMIAYTHEIRYR